MKTFLQTPYVRQYLRLIGLYFSGYVAVQYRSVPLTDVSSPLDDRIPEMPVAGAYLALFSFPISFLTHTFFADPSSESVAVVKGVLSNVEHMYRQSCAIYAIKQTTFRRPPARSLKLKLLRSVDRNRNCFPSLHAQVVAEMYNCATLLPAGHKEKVGVSEEQVLAKTISILESCLLTKQHSIQDIAAGLAGVTLLDPTFTPEKAKNIFSRMFRDSNYGMSGQLTEEIRGRMGEVYDAMIVAGSRGDSYVEVFSRAIENIAAGRPLSIL